MNTGNDKRLILKNTVEYPVDFLICTQQSLNHNIWIQAPRIVLSLTLLIFIFSSVFLFIKYLFDKQITDFSSKIKLAQRKISDILDDLNYRMNQKLERKVKKISEKIEQERSDNTNFLEQKVKVEKYLQNQEQKINVKIAELDEIMEEQDKFMNKFEKSKNLIMARFKEQEVSVNIKCKEKLQLLEKKTEERERKLHQIIANLENEVKLNIDIIV